MRRLLFALLAAVGVHGLFFVWEFDLTQSRLRTDPEHRTLHMTLTCLAPAKPEVKLVEKPQAPRRRPPVRPPDPPPKKDKAPKPVQSLEKKPMVTPQARPPEEESLTPLPEVPPQALPQGPAQPAITKELSDKTDSESVAFGSKMASNIVREAVPMYRSNTPPAYPRWARKRGWQGTVLLEILVDVQGRARDIRIHESSGYQVLDEAAASAAEKWMFIPGMRGDSPVEMWVRVPVTFQLQ